MGKFEYMEHRVPLVEHRPVVRETADFYAEEENGGWEVVSVWPASIAHVRMLFKRLKSDPTWGEQVAELDRRVLNDELQHNHPKGTGCTESCPVLREWNRIGSQRA